MSRWKDAKAEFERMLWLNPSDNQGPDRLKLAEALSQELEGELQASEWPPGWIEATAGSIADPTFVRHPQGDYEEREKLE